MPIHSAERAYLKHRAEQELWMTLHAACIESEAAHNELTSSYLQACVDCLDGESAECCECPLHRVCEIQIKSRH